MVVAALDQQSTRRAMQLLRSLPPQERYAALKELLQLRYSLSASERAEKILSMPGLGDSSAVDLMDSMLSLLSSDEGGFLFPHIFLRQLPPPVRAALVNSPRLAAGDYRGLAEEADRVLLATRRFTVQHVTSDARLQETEDNPVSVSAVGVGTRRGTFLCLFHQRFGTKAKRCVPLCPAVVYRVLRASEGGSVYTIAPIDDLGRTKQVHRSLLKAIVGEVPRQSNSIPMDAPQPNPPRINQDDWADGDLFIVRPDHLGRAEVEEPPSEPPLEPVATQPSVPAAVGDSSLTQPTGAGSSSVPLRRTSRATAGHHSNLHRLPRSVEGQPGVTSQAVSVVFRPWT
ncbi:uncharacterized protein LOC144983791 [Oryzias latipes]